MMIEGTGLTAMTREADDMYDVNGSTLPANGVGDVTVDGAMYHVWMDGGALMGARFDSAFDGTTDMFTGDLAAPALSANDPETAANELRTHLILTGSAAEGEGMFSMGALLGTGMATDEGARFVDTAVEAISEVRSDVTSLLALDSTTLDLDAILENQWTKIETALTTVFKTPPLRISAPREEDILDEIDDILDALASKDGFVAATAANGGGVFENQDLDSSAAMDAFNRVTWSATATMGSTGATRYGTAFRKETLNAQDKLAKAEIGAFSYSTISETLRTSQAAAVSLTGIASYSGGTEAISGDGTTYSGTMDLQVRFSANTVSGVVSGLLDSDGLPWQHNFADVDRIVLDDANLQRNAQWNNQNGSSATVFYTADSGLLRPITGLENTFRGILLGTGADAGSQANGVWSVNDSGSTNYLTGGFGVMHVGDASRPLPGGDAGGASNATLITNTNLPTLANNDASVDTFGGASIADGKLTVKLQRYGWVRSDNDTLDNLTDDTVTYQGLVDDMGTSVRGPDGIPNNADDVATAIDDDEPVFITAEFDLEALAENGAGAKTTVNGPKWVDSVKATLQAQRDQIATLQALGTRTASTRAAEAAAWQIAVDAIQYQLFGGDLPMKLAGDYTAANSNLPEEAVGLLERALDALSSANKLFAALDPEGTGIFDHYWTDTNNDGTVDDNEINDFIKYDATVDRRWETIGNNRALSAFLGEREHKVIASLGTTDYTRFGVWYRIGAVSAERAANTAPNGVKKGEGGPGSFAYSPLDPTMAGNEANPAFPIGGSASYVGETAAIMDEDVLTGTARVDVSWAAAADLDLDLTTGPDGTETANVSNAGVLTLTLSDLADADGDPLVRVATRGDVNPTRADATKGDLNDKPATWNEIADIVFANLPIEVGLAGGNSGRLIVGAETVGTGDAASTYTYSEIGIASIATAEVRYRFRDIGMDDVIVIGSTITDTATASLESLFVGQGVDGPLGVIGTWTLADESVARVNAAGSGTDDAVIFEDTNAGANGTTATTETAGLSTIRGGFGADIP